MDMVASEPDAPSRSDEVVLLLRDRGLVRALEDVHQQLERLLDAGPSSLTVDLTGVDVTSTTVAALLWVKRRCAARGVEVAIRGHSRRSVEVLKRIGFVDAGGRLTGIPVSSGLGDAAVWART
jgi:anti-anti-sigma regulatory factor